MTARDSDLFEIVECRSGTCSITFRRERETVGRPQQYHSGACKSAEYRRQKKIRENLKAGSLLFK